jgi:ornithine decarboxylase
MKDVTRYQKTKKSFYIVNLEELKHLHTYFTALLPLVNPYYAVKCNPNPNIIECLNSLNTNFDCASQSEIQSIMEITNDPSRIIYANPCKSAEDLQYAAKHNIQLLTFDCIEELNKIHDYHPHAHLIMRLAVDDSHSLMKFNSKFGATLDQITLLMMHAIQLGLHIVGFSFHVGSCCKDPTTYYRALQKCKEASLIAQQYGISISIIDIGGGFSMRPVSSILPASSHLTEGSTNLPSNGLIYNRFEEMADQINRGIEDFFSDMDVRFIAEPGRYFVESTHTLVVNVIGKKRGVNGFIYTINESVYQSFNNIIFDYYKPVFKLVDERDGARYETTIFGQTCDSLDKIADGIMLPELNIGDWLYVENMGAYTYAAASRFNGFSIPDIYYI